MFKQSFGADTFGRFWQNWNPLFSYYLMYKVYKPLKSFLPRWMSVLITFAVSGALHDLFASIVLQKWYSQFTLMFVLFALWVIIEAMIPISLKNIPVWIRPLYHLFLIVSLFIIASEYRK